MSLCRRRHNTGITDKDAAVHSPAQHSESAITKEDALPSSQLANLGCTRAFLMFHTSNCSDSIVTPTQDFIYQRSTEEDSLDRFPKGLLLDHHHVGNGEFFESGIFPESSRRP